ncbi:hypothetical protein MMC25_007804 [Agyrium rufum]|nr:hypothetical protein [Agyrium rufum]
MLERRTTGREPGMGDQDLDGAFRMRDNAVFTAASIAKAKVSGIMPTKKNEPSTQLPTINVKITEDGYGEGPKNRSTHDYLEVMCGPLLNYKRMSGFDTDTPTWHGSVLVVTKPGTYHPTLSLRYHSQISPSLKGGSSSLNPVASLATDVSDRTQHRTFEASELYVDPVKAFWQFSIEVPLQKHEARWEYTVSNVTFVEGSSPQAESTRRFVVPAASQSMHIMFHSCNGFSVGTDEEAWSGPALWNDVMRMHKTKPFHVIIGGGDQIYNDGVRVKGPLRPWTDIVNPRKRRDYPFPETLRKACDDYYFSNYNTWYATEAFASANAQIAQINIFDDHDIIDGFGSYTDHFMTCAVFRGIGGVAFKYYCLFQHHVPPPRSTYTTDAPQTAQGEGIDGPGMDPAQLKDTFVMAEKPDSSFIIGKRPGPYVEEPSRSLYMRLGKSMAFMGIDARTERTRHQINYPDTYDLIFQRVSSELAATPDIRHLIVLLGVPIAYPRLIWLENFFTSPLLAPVRLLNKRFGVAGALFNKFDGQIDLLDDLDDHYTARQHKAERKDLILRLQKLASLYSVRVTILGGDVHLAAVGRFYSKTKLGLPAGEDHRYMVNVISSAITNKPPPKAVANLLARRNKIHHLDHETDETLMPFFDKEPAG